MAVVIYALFCYKHARFAESFLKRYRRDNAVLDDTPSTNVVCMQHAQGGKLMAVRPPCDIG
jgi:hypothetical protein